MNQSAETRGETQAGTPHDSQDERRILSATKLLALIASLLLGVASGLFFLSQVFLSIPSDVQRLGFLFESLRDTQPRPRIVAFGDSVLMSGIDARVFEAVLPDRTPTWNCAYAGQTFTEAFLLTQQAPSTVEVAIYGVPIRAGSSENPLYSQKYNTLFMSGFRPSPQTKRLLSDLHGEAVRELLNRSWLGQIFLSRWIIRQSLDTSIRQVLRRDLALSKSSRDLVHPQPYEKKVDPKISTRFLARGIEKFRTNGVDFSAGTAEMVDALASEAERKDRKLVFLFPPLHPEITERYAAEIDAATREFSSRPGPAEDALYLDATRLLAREYFIDDKHPTNEGARILSEFVATAVGRL